MYRTYFIVIYCIFLVSNEIATKISLYEKFISHSWLIRIQRKKLILAFNIVCISLNIILFRSLLYFKFFPTVAIWFSITKIPPENHCLFKYVWYYYCIRLSTASHMKNDLVNRISTFDDVNLFVFCFHTFWTSLCNAAYHFL